MTPCRDRIGPGGTGWGAVASVTVPMVLVVYAGVATTAEATASRMDGRRGDLPAETLLLMFTGLVSQGLRLLAEGKAGPERASAAVIGLFLDGASQR